jgi:hypothetical protein
VVDASTGAPVPVIFSTSTTSNAVNRDYAVPTYMALAASVPARTASVGYAGTVSDGLTPAGFLAHADPVQFGARLPHRGHRRRDPRAQAAR